MIGTSETWKLCGNIGTTESFKELLEDWYYRKLDSFFGMIGTSETWKFCGNIGTTESFKELLEDW